MLTELMIARNLWVYSERNTCESIHIFRMKISEVLSHEIGQENIIFTVMYTFYGTYEDFGGPAFPALQCESASTNCKLM